MTDISLMGVMERLTSGMELLRLRISPIDYRESGIFARASTAHKT